MNKPEILAPAGSIDALYAAVNAGADAVYLGGSRYGARAYAGNFDETELLEGIRYAHLFGVKVYLTVNTLFRNEEIENLYDYLMPYYKEGLDAVIVQDFGVMTYIHEKFPKLPIHASTQMTITTPYAFELLREYGVTRIVPARELSIDELKQMKNNNDFNYGANTPELEVFVQGALCLCYSGQCLMSSFIGGRSGNRGRCAGSCRLPYSIKTSEGKAVKTQGDYLLSQKDLCGLAFLPKLMEIGVDSFKIEGRMKSPEYVAVCVRSYRKCVDHLLDVNRNDTDYDKLVADCLDDMAEVFNRSGFTKGYFDKKNGRDMMSTVYPGHMGVSIGVITSIKNNKLNIRLSKDVSKGDIFVINNVDNEEIVLTSNIEERSGYDICINAPKTRTLRNGMTVFRRFNHPLQKELSAFVEQRRKNTVNGTVNLKKGEEASLSVKTVINGKEVEATYKGAIVSEAATKPLSAENVRDKILQTGNSYFEFSNLNLFVEDNIFIPIRELKDLRRNAFSLLEEEIYGLSRRSAVKHKEQQHIEAEDDISSAGNAADTVKHSDDIYYNGNVRILVSGMEQLKTVEEFLKGKNAANITLDLQYFSKEDIIHLMHGHPEYGLALPMIMRRPEFEELKEIPLNECGVVLVRNIDELAYLKHIGYDGMIIADYSLYSMNDRAIDFIRSQFYNAVITYPVELNDKQLLKLEKSSRSTEWIVYGYQPLMVSAQCFSENTDGCKRGSDPSYVLRDRKNQYFYTKAFCKYCYNIIYNGIPTVLFDKEQFAGAYKGTKRLHFTMENREQIKNVLDAYYNGAGYDGECTGGHFNRGVE